VSELVDARVIQTTLAESLGAINAANLKKAHTLIESGRSRGKIVLKGFSSDTKYAIFLGAGS